MQCLTTTVFIALHFHFSGQFFVPFYCIVKLKVGPSCNATVPVKGLICHEKNIVMSAKDSGLNRRRTQEPGFKNEHVITLVISTSDYNLWLRLSSEYSDVILYFCWYYFQIGKAMKKNKFFSFYSGVMLMEKQAMMITIMIA